MKLSKNKSITKEKTKTKIGYIKYLFKKNPFLLKRIKSCRKDTISHKGHVDEIKFFCCCCLSIISCSHIYSSPWSAKAEL